MTTPVRAPTTIRDLLSQLLDRGYVNAIRPVIEAMGQSLGKNSLIGQRLNEFEAEAQRLVNAGQRLTANNVVLSGLLNAIEDALGPMARLLDDNADVLIEAGLRAGGVIARQLALPGISDQALSTIGIAWNRPDPEALARVIHYADSAAWQTELTRYQTGISRTVRDVALRGIASGQGPLDIAYNLNFIVPNLPITVANNLMRTLQLQSYRDATTANYLANARILEYQVRLATLDRRTCLACWALHGTIMRLGERIVDHHQGRCTAVPKVRGLPLNITPGVDRWARLSPAEQLATAGPAKFAAMQAGAASLEDFVGEYTDPVFGRLIREESLRGVLGADAQQYYRGAA